ncbi:MAG: hypothetical protein JWP29_3550 [Rhodoferax sp.]|nr:hypothetical protein [Rhodoferax sp.]
MALRGHTRTVDHGHRRIMAEIRQLDGRSIKVGIQTDAGEEDNGTAIVDVAIYNEFGTEHIPSRPFFRRMADNYRGQLHQVAMAAYEGILRGGTAMRCLGVVGTWYQDMQKRVLRDGPWVPNSPLTIKLKRSATPLIDHSRMVNAIRYVVQRGKR